MNQSPAAARLRRPTPPVDAVIDQKKHAGSRLSRTRLRTELASYLDVLESTDFAWLAVDYDGTLTVSGSGHELPKPEVQAAVTRVLDLGVGLAVVSGRGRSLHQELRAWVPERHWGSVLAAMHTGGTVLHLTEEVSADGLPAPQLTTKAAGELRRLAAAIRVEPGLRNCKFDERPAQLSVKPPETTPQWLEQVQMIVADMMRDRRLDLLHSVVSSYAVDVLPAEVDKSRIFTWVDPEHTLALGDSGQPGGNDFTLLSGVQSSVSVDRCSADPTRCWRLDREQRGPVATVRVLDLLEDLAR